MTPRPITPPVTVPAGFKPMRRTTHLPLDIMDAHADRYICTLRYPWPRSAAIIAVRAEDILAFIYAQRPSLRRRDITFLLDDLPLRPRDFKNFTLQPI